MTEETVKWLFNNGLAVAIIAAIFLGVHRGGKAFMELVLVPMKNAAIAYFQGQTENLEKSNITQQKLGQTMDRVCEELSETRRDVAAIKANTQQCPKQLFGHGQANHSEKPNG